MDASIRVMTVEQVSEATGIDRRKVQELTRTGYFKRAPIPGRIYIYENSVYDQLRQSDTKTTSTN